MNYAKHYDLLMSKAKSRKSLEGYFEKHHILPKCLGGGDEEQNLVILTPEEHYLAHLMLVRIYPGSYALSYAALLMTRSTKNVLRNNKMYGWLKRSFSKNNSEFQKDRFESKQNHPCFGKFGKDHPRYGCKHTDEFKMMISKLNKGKVLSLETKRKMSESMKLKFSTEEYKSKISSIRKIIFLGERNPAYGTKMINDGKVRKRIPREQDVPEGWKLGAKL